MAAPAFPRLQPQVTNVFCATFFQKSRSFPYLRTSALPAHQPQVTTLTVSALLSRSAPASDAECLARLRLARSDRVGPATYRRLLHRCGSAVAAIQALPDLARAGGGVPLKVYPENLARREQDRVAKLGARLLFVDAPDYPPLLALLPDAPSCLTVLGDPVAWRDGGVAIVGSRNALAGGCLMAAKLAEALAGAGKPVVSGLARGIDTAAHTGALRRGLTLAAIAGGIDVPYPEENADLQRRIADQGAVLTEAPLGTAPQSRHFPRRNRIIAGLSLGVVVIEAAPKSGSLITARLALEAGRELFAVPGSPLDPRCLGSNDLIRQGAHLTERAEDVLANLPTHPLEQGVRRLALFAHDDAEPGGLAEAQAPGPVPDPPAWLHDAVLEMLSPTPASVDDMVAHCQVSAAAVNAVLLELELAGRVTFLPGNRVAAISADAWTLDAWEQDA